MSAESMLIHEPVIWRAVWRLEKFWGDDVGPDAVPYDVIEREGNMLMHGGASAVWQALLGNGTATPGQPLTYFNSVNAHLGVGDSSTAAVATQTDLQAATNKIRKAMDASYPQHTDGTAPGNATVVFRSTFTTSEANFPWQEWGVFNSNSGGRMLNRKVESLGTKTAAASWVLTCSLSIS